MALIDTFPLDSKAYGFEWLRYMLEVTPLQEGVIGANDYKVTAAAAGGMRVDIAAGAAVVQGDAGTRNAKYIQVNDAAIAPALTFDAADASLPRVDQVVLQINDSNDLASGSDTPTLTIVKGTATSGATLDNRNGAAALPNNALRLADVLIPAASVAVVAGNIRDRRPWARGAYIRVLRNANAASGADYTTTSATDAAVDAANVAPRIECSGVPLRLSIHGQIANTTLNQWARFRWALNGIVTALDAQHGYHWVTPTTTVDVGLNSIMEIIPPAGSNLFVPYWATQAGTLGLRATASGGASFVVEEVVRQNAQNG